MSRTAIGLAALGLLLSPAAAEACTPPSVTFASGSDRLAAEQLSVIDEVMSDWRRRQPGTRLIVSGGADRVGPAGMNLRLSRRRAESVKAEFVRRGVPARLITAQGSGETGSGADGVADRSSRIVFIDLAEPAARSASIGCGAG
jgi:outer membrane protein OmpA-like peptidoglycan-associated protein